MRVKLPPLAENVSACNQDFSDYSGATLPVVGGSANYKFNVLCRRSRFRTPDTSPTVAHRILYESIYFQEVTCRPSEPCLPQLKAQVSPSATSTISGRTTRLRSVTGGNPGRSSGRLQPLSATPTTSGGNTGQLLYAIHACTNNSQRSSLAKCWD